MELQNNVDNVGFRHSEAPEHPPIYEMSLLQGVNCTRLVDDVDLGVTTVFDSGPPRARFRKGRSPFVKSRATQATRPVPVDDIPS